MIPRKRLPISFGLVCCFALFGIAMKATGGEPVYVVAADGPDRGAVQPQAAVDANGRIYVVFGRENTIRCAISDDEGKTFAVFTVGEVPELSLGMRRGPRIAATEGRIVVTAIGGTIGKGRDGDVLCWQSKDDGKTWAGPSRVNTVDGSAREGLHGMASGPGGSVFCTWLDLRNRTSEIFGARSKDGGATWEPDGLVYRSPDKSVCECCHPSAAYGPDGALHVMWRNQLKGARDLYLARSEDGGKTFGKAEKLGSGTWQLNACPMDGGAIAAGPGKAIETVWMRSGAMFSAKPGEKEKTLGRGVQGWTALNADGAYTVWLEKRPGKLLALLPGQKGPMTLAEQASDPMIAAGLGGQGPVVAVWEVKSEGGGISAQVLAPRSKTPPLP